jgi:arylsulfatase A-like enzyme
MSRHELSRRDFLRSTGGAAACLALGAGAAEARAAVTDTARMNVLLIDIEDCTPNAIGCYGNKIVRTPNIDRLAASGVRFDRAYCQYPCCNPSRSSFLTGLRPPTTGVLSNGMNMMKTLPKHAVSLPELMKKKGFYTANIAKLFHRVEESVPQMLAFDRLERSARPPGWKGPGAILRWPGVPRPPGWKRPPKGVGRSSPEYRKWRRWQSDRYGPSGLTEEQEHDGRVARTAVALLKEFAKEKRHFFLSVGSSRPHTPLIAPKKYIDLYDPAGIPPPPAPPEKDRNVPDVARRFGRSADIFMTRRASEKEAREAVAAYYACVSLVDAGVGLILDTLQKEGLADNTIVIFLADHGFHLGEHGLWSKYTLFESSTRVPLIVRVPGAAGNGQVCREIVELVDLVPTLCELSGLEASEKHEGVSWAPLLADPKRPWKKAAFTYFGNKAQHRCVRTRRYKYAEWSHKGETVRELYDLQADPWETVNLADEPAHSETAREHARLLRAGWKAALPPKTPLPKR